MIFIFRVFDVSVRRIGTEKRPAFGSGFLCAFDSAGEVAAVQVIDQRPKRGIEAVDIQRVAAVKSVVDGNEAYTEEREHARNIVSHGEIITAKAGQVFLCQVGTKKIFENLQAVHRRTTTRERLACELNS